MKSEKSIFTKRSATRKKGALTIELVLIFPILMLLFFLFYQVTVMLLTYHSLQTTATHAVLTAADATSLTEITNVLKKGTASWYYEPENTLTPASAATWTNASELTFRILKWDQTTSKWKYVVTDADLPASGTELIVEIKLPKLRTTYPQYWLMPQFKGVDDGNTDAFVISAMNFRK